MKNNLNFAKFGTASHPCVCVCTTWLLLNLGHTRPTKLTKLPVLIEGIVGKILRSDPKIICISVETIKAKVLGANLHRILSCHT